VDGSNKAQPVTAAPELGLINGAVVVYIGTGQLLNSADLSSTAVQSVYALMDDSRPRPISPLRPKLQKHTFSTDASGNVAIDAITMDWSAYRGWYVDATLTPGERFLSSPKLIQGVIYLVWNAPSGVACSSLSALLSFDYQSGNELPADRFHDRKPWVQLPIGTTLAALPTVLQLSDGTLVALIHRADNSVATQNLALPPAGGFKKAGWRAVTQ
jgi:type IV pilus assembly protein PilY1